MTTERHGMKIVYRYLCPVGHKFDRYNYRVKENCPECNAVTTTYQEMQDETEEIVKAVKASTTQVGGNHYKDRPIQPVEYSERNNLSFLEGCIVKRITRWKEKDGIKDLRKIQHEVDLIIEIHELGNSDG